MEKNLAELIGLLAGMRRELTENFTVRRIGVFGSYARGDQDRESDADIIVELDEPTFDHYMDLKFRLEEVLGLEVDLVLADTVKPRLRPVIEREAVYAWGSQPVPGPILSRTNLISFPSLPRSLTSVT